MIKILKDFRWIIIFSVACILLGVLTFLTFINAGFIPLNEENLQILLLLDLILTLIFFGLIFKASYKIFIKRKQNKVGSQTSTRYITLFSLFTFIPSFLIAIFSLIIFNFGIQKYFDNQITKAVNNSYGLAKNYLEESTKNVTSDVILMSVGINRVSNLFYLNRNQFKNIVQSEKLLRRIDDVYLIDSLGNIIFESSTTNSNFIQPTEENFERSISGQPVIISSSLNNKTSAMVKLNTLIDTYLYISRNIDPKILNYLADTEQAVNFYYTVESKQTGIKITFAVIYIILVSLLLFLSTSIAISFATRLTKPIVNLISASENISRGLLDTKVPTIETDKEFTKLNKNFNNMIDRLKEQQDKLLLAERYSAWESVARKLAHEIKNPLTPIQLSIDRLQEKYLKKINEGQDEFKNYLETINRQIKYIENLVNEFSSFARMPSPQFKKINILNVINKAMDFFSMSSKNNFINNTKETTLIVNGDVEQLNRVFINLIKNSEESIQEKQIKYPDFKGKIEVEFLLHRDYINIKLYDNGCGLANTKKIMTPYFTTKKNGTGLGLPIVNKIINEHMGEFSINNLKNGAVVSITLPLVK